MLIKQGKICISCLYILLHFHETVSAVALQGSVSLAAYQSKADILDERRDDGEK